MHSLNKRIFRYTSIIVGTGYSFLYLLSLIKCENGGKNNCQYALLYASKYLQTQLHFDSNACFKISAQNYTKKKKKKKKKKKTFVKFCEELLYFQYSVKIFFLCSKSVIITTFKKIEYISLLCLLAWLVWITLICSNYPCLENILWFQGVRAIEVILYS